MRIRELIEQLENVYDKEGNCSVYFITHDGMSARKVEQVDTIKQRSAVVILR